MLQARSSPFAAAEPYDLSGCESLRSRFDLFDERRTHRGLYLKEQGNTDLHLWSLVHEHIGAVMGENTRDAIYRYMDMRYQVECDELPEKVEILHRTLMSILGVEATKLLEAMIARRIYASLGLSFEDHEDWILIDYLNHAREMKES